MSCLPYRFMFSFYSYFRSSAFSRWSFLDSSISDCTRSLLSSVLPFFCIVGKFARFL